MGTSGAMRSNEEIDDPVARATELAGSAATLDALLEGTLRALVSAIPEACCAVALLDEGGILRVRASVGLDIELDERFGLRIGEGYAGAIAASRAPLTLVDPAHAPIVRSPALRDADLRSVHGVPLFGGGEVVGVLHVGSRTATDWSAEAQALVRAVAGRVSPAIALHVVRAAAERRARQQATVAELGRNVLRTPGRRAVLERAIAAVEQGLEGPCVALLELTASRAFVVHSYAGWRPEELDELASVAETALHARAASGGEPVVVSELGEDAPSFLPAAERARGLRSAVAVPVPFGPARTFGVIVAHSRTRAAFGPSHVDFLVAVANIVGECLVRFEEQERLRRSEETLRLAAEAAQLGTWEWSVETGALTWSEVTKEIYGLPRDAEVDYPRFLSLLPSLERTRIEGYVADALRPDGPGRMDFEHEIRRADGATRRLSAHAQTLFDEMRRPVRLVGTTVDVTAARRMAELQDFIARASAELAISLDVSETVRVVARLPLPSFADLVMVGLFVSDAEVEHVAVRTSSRTHDELARALERAGPRPRCPIAREPSFGASPARLVTPVDDEALRDMAADERQLALLRAMGVRSFVVAPLVGRGRAFGMLSFGSSTRAYDDVDLAMAEAFGARAALAIDNARLFADQVAARESAEAARAALAASEERRRLALDAAAMGTWQWDRRSGLIAADARARLLMNAPPEGPFTPAQLLTTVHEADREGLRAALDRAATRGEGTTIEFRVLEAAGSVRWLSGTGRVEVDARGETVRWMGIVQDVTRRKVDEQHAAAASRAKNEFLAMLGHELRNPLAPIATAVQLMKMRGSKADERERSIIERQVRHLSRLVDDLLDVSRITAGRVKLDVASVEIGDVVAQAIETASPLLEQRRQTLAVDVARQGLVVRGDPVRLAQVIANLLTNSAKYTHPGGHVRVSAARDGESIAIRVADDGMGIARELLPKVFDVFSQGVQAIDRSQGGLGLGLAIVKSLVAMHGGSVEASSAGEGKGTTMTVRLPAQGAPRRLDSSEMAAVLPKKEGPRLRVLVVDDNVDAAELLDEALEAAGFEVVTSFDPLAALDAASRHRPDIAVLDLGLPVMDGYELATRLRALPGLERLPVVAVTGYGQEADRERGRLVGFDAHLVKPVDLRQLATVLGSLVAAPPG